MVRSVRPQSADLATPRRCFHIAVQGLLSFPLVFLVLIALLAGGVEQAQADTIINTVAFAAIPLATIPVTPFDPTLGRLDKVGVSITGVLGANGLAPPFIINNVPQPYQYEIEVSHVFTGLGGKYFEFETAAEFIFTGPATGAGDAIDRFQPFTYSFGFDETSDLIGGVVPAASGPSQPPLFIRGTRARFLKTDVAFDMIQLVNMFQSHSLPPITPVGFGCSASMTITYDFTPVSVGAGSPHAAVTLSGSEFHAGQTLTVGVEAENPAGNPAADLYVGALLPDGQTVVLLSGSGGLAGPSSLANPAGFTRLQTMPQGSVLHAPSLFQLTFPATGIPAGIYQVFTGLARQGAFEDNRIDSGDILTLDVKALAFSP